MPKRLLNLLFQKQPIETAEDDFVSESVKAAFERNREASAQLEAAINELLKENDRLRKDRMDARHARH